MGRVAMSVENPSKHRTLDRRKILFAGTALTAASALGTGTPLRTAPAQAAGQLNPQPLPPSPGWTRALPPGPDLRVKITEEYAKHVARDAFFWAWPLVNIYNKRRGAEQSKVLAYAGPVPAAPLNRIVMLTDYVAADERIVACPNQDVVYGGGSLGLEQSPVVIQVPDFGDRFWVYQAVDLRSDSFVQLGKMYGTTPGFYLLAGPRWRERSQRASGRFSAPRLILASSRRAYSWTTRLRTARRSSRCCGKSCCTRWQNMTAG